MSMLTQSPVYDNVHFQHASLCLFSVIVVFFYYQYINLYWSGSAVLVVYFVHNEGLNP